MNALFDPSLLFIADTDWDDDKKRDDFLTHLTDNLQSMNEYDLANIWWTDELQTILVGEPNMHPWYGSDLSNQIVVILHQKFYNRLDYFEESETVCDISPPLKITYTNANAHEHFLRLAHNLIVFEEPFYFCIGLENQLLGSDNYVFSCECHHLNYTPILINVATDWLQYIDTKFIITVLDYFPKTVENFEAQFTKGMEFIKKQYFPKKDYLFEYEFTKNFQKSIISRTTFQEEIFIAVVKKLVLNAKEAANSDLHDEFIKKIKNPILGKPQQMLYRIRVTQRPSSTRIQYVLDGNKIIFRQYYGEGEHDDGL
jgi:hypothetical protein